MTDIFFRRDIGTVSSFTDSDALFDFPQETREQTVHNDNASAAVVLEVSFDGVNVHARLQGTGPSKVIHWSDHVRKRVYVRKASGSPDGTANVEVLAHTT
jgi:hypothetical protein